MASAMSACQTDCGSRLAKAREQLSRAKSDAYVTELVGTIGADPSVLA
jgi:hypothetical protein